MASAAYQRAYYKANAERIKEYRRAYYKANSEKQREYQRAYYAANRDSCAASKRGVDVATVTPRPKVCDACGREPGARSLHLDHDHKTGKFRGWLCAGCNASLGHCKDDPEILGSLIDYLKSGAASGAHHNRLRARLREARAIQLKG